MKMVCVCAAFAALAITVVPPAVTAEEELLTDISIGQRLSIEQLQELLVGNTEIGEYRWSGKWQPYREYFDPNGSIRGLDNQEPYRGTWQIKGDLFCAEYTGGGDACFYYERTDSGYTAFNKEGDVKARIFRIEKGKAL